MSLVERRLQNCCPTLCAISGTSSRVPSTSRSMPVIINLAMNLDIDWPPKRMAALIFLPLRGKGETDWPCKHDASGLAHSRIMLCIILLKTAQSTVGRCFSHETRIRTFVERQHKKAREISRGLSELIPAASYSPTQLPAQYHRLQEA